MMHWLTHNRMAWGRGALLTGVLLLAWSLLPTLFYLSEDSISRAAIDTERRLSRYERTARPGDLLLWLSTYHGDAPDHQVMITLGQWSVRRQEPFLTLVDGFTKEQRREFVWRFAFALGDSGQREAFLHAFQGYRSPTLAAIFRELGHGIGV